MIKRLLTALLVLTLCLSLLPLGMATTVEALTPDVTTYVREGTVMVSTWLDTDGGDVELGWGTGFFVGTPGENPSYLLTNCHVIQPFIDYGSGELFTMDDGSITGRAKIRVFFESDDFEEAYLVDSDSIKDVALLRLDNATSKRHPLSLKVPTNDMSGSSATAVGYPGLAENIFANSTSSFGLNDASVTPGAISRVFTTAGTGVQSLQITCDIYPGNSGGPLVDDDGNVLGINTYLVSGEDGQINYAVNISEAIPFLKLHDVPHVTDAGTGSATAPSTEPIGGGSSTDTNDGENDDNEEINEKEEEKESNALLIVLAAVIVLGLAAFLVIKKTKKSVPVMGGPTGGTVAFTGTQPAGGGSGRTSVNIPAQDLRFQGVAGTFAGKRYSVNGTVRFGRQPQNDMSYPQNAQGVSGTHCSLTIQGNAMYLTDLGSSYGTFLNGRKLAPNTPAQVRAGDKFSLGSDREMFAIVPKGGA